MQIKITRSYCYITTTLAKIRLTMTNIVEDVEQFILLYTAGVNTKWNDHFELSVYGYTLNI